MKTDHVLAVEALVAVECDGEIDVHLPPAAGRDRDTLCGLAVDEPGGGPIRDGHGAVDGMKMKIVPVPAGAKVGCAPCEAIWRVAARYWNEDFE